MQEFITYPRKNYRDSELFFILRAYLLYKTGELLTPNGIATDLKKIFSSKNLKPSDDTISKFLKAMTDSGEIIKLTREYVKPQYTKDYNSKDVSLSFGHLYYLSYQYELLETLYTSDHFRIIAERKSSRGNKPGLETIYRKTMVCQRLRALDEDIKSGVIIYHYNGEDGKDNKITIPVDFIVNKNGAKTIYIFSGIKSMFKWEKEKRGEHVLNAILSIKRFAKFPVKVITLWDNEPNSLNLEYVKKKLSEHQYEMMSWDEV